MPAEPPKKHTWRFARVGGFDQVQLDRGADLVAIAELDQKLWVALSCPVRGLEFDEKTLALIDTDHDGRIRAPEVIAAVTWAASVLKSPETLVDGAAALPLKAIDAEKEEGRRLLSSAKQILANLGKKGAKEISVAETSDTARIFAQTKFNGDGVVPVTSADDEDVQKAIQEVIDCVGSEVDRSGAPGVSQALVDKFFAEAGAFSAWWKQAESEPAVLPLGEATSAAVEAFHAVKGKVDDYFARARLAAFDPRAAAPLNRDAAEYAALAVKELSPSAPEVASFPLAQVEANRPLPLDGGINPAWAQAVAKLRAEVITPLLGAREAITDAEWSALCAKIAPFDAWRAGRAGALVEKLGVARVRALIEGDFKVRIEDLIARDKALEPEANAIDSVDKLVRYARDLATLANNFVTFRDFYARKKAIFQAGTLYLDGRSCELCVKVTDVAAHAAVAAASGTFLAYCECTRLDVPEKMNIVAAFTGGDASSLNAGRNGVFYDRKGRDWDATIVKLVEHPISVRHAFFAPYRRVAKLVSDQVTKFASSRDQAVHDHAAARVPDPSKARDSAPPPAPVPLPLPAPPAPAVPAAPAQQQQQRPMSTFDVGRTTGVLAAIFIGMGALGSAVTAIVTGFLSLAWWQMPLALAGVLLIISGPAMLLAWLRLRRRNIGPILDAAGWAVNARARMNIPFGASLTAVAELPEGAERSLQDPFEEQRTPWVRYAVLAMIVAGIAIAWKLGYPRSMMASREPPPAPAPSGSASATPK